MLDWRIYENYLASRDMLDIWSEQASISNWLLVERKLARCQAKLRLIPEQAAQALSNITFVDLDQDKLKQDMALVGRPIVGLVKQLRAIVGEDLSAHIHYGTTTQDIMDTAMVLQMRDGLHQIHIILDETMIALGDLNAQYGSIPMMGRTNGQHALPITFGHKLSQWQTELGRRQQVIREASSRALMVQFGGAVGDLRSYPDGIGLQLRAALANALGLESNDHHWQNSRDGVADLVQALGSLCASLCKIAHNVNLLASSDIDEVREGHCEGRGASSAMAHKKNQRSSEFAEALARLGRQRAEQMGELTLHEHERSGGVWIGEWILVPEVFILTSGALMWMQRLFSNLEIQEQSMRAKVVQV